MEQKLYVVEIIDNGEMVLPQDLQKLLNAGWKIVQISTIGSSVGREWDICVLLLQK